MDGLLKGIVIVSFAGTLIFSAILETTNYELQFTVEQIWIMMQN